MECPTSPTGFLAVLLARMQAVLGTAPSTVPGQIVVGQQGAGNAYTCCDTGLLRIEWLEMLDAEGESRNCDSPRVATFRVTVDRCVQSFDNAATAAPVALARRNAEALALTDEAWRVYSALRCAVYNDWRDCWVVLGSMIPKEPEGLCWGYHVDIRTDFLGGCCG